MTVSTSLSVTGQPARAGSKACKFGARHAARTALGAGSDQLGFSTLQGFYLPPGVEAPLQEGVWVELTAHFRDPASDTCRMRPFERGSSGGHIPSDGYGRIANLLEAPASVRLDCWRRLVVESITVVDGP